MKESNIVLIETNIKNMEYPAPKELLKVVDIPEKEFDEILGYLIRTQHILINKGRIIWIWGGPVVDEILSNKEDWITV